MNYSKSAFISISQLNALVNLPMPAKSADKSQSNILSMQDIVNTVIAPHLPASNRHLKIINRSILLRKLFKTALDANASFYSPAQIAASSELKHNQKQTDQNFNSSVVRIGPGFEIKFIQANATNTELYAILKLDEYNAKQEELGVFMHCQWQEKFYMLHLQYTSNGKFQTLIDQNFAMFEACFDNSTHWFVN